MEEINKATHEPIHMWSPVVKGKNGNYIAVLSDDSVDRHDEIVGKSALHGIMNNDGYTAILLNHKNDVMMQIGEWTNKRIEEINGHTAFVCEPKFYLSNPNASIIKGCMDEGAQYGISIGAIPKASEIQKINGKNMRVYTELELLEASFVAIPANKHGRAMAVAKMFESHKEEKQMEEPIVEKIIEETVVVEKTYTEKEYNETIEVSTKAFDALALEKKMIEESLSKMMEENNALKAKVEVFEKMVVLKNQNTIVEEGDGSANINKENDGKMPIIKRK